MADGYGPGGRLLSRYRIHATGDFIRFTNIAYGSLMALETHLILANRLDYMDSEATNALLARTGKIGKMLNGLRTSLRAHTDNR